MKRFKTLKKNPLSFVGRKVPDDDRGWVKFLAPYPAVRSFRHDLLLLRRKYPQISLFNLRRQRPDNAEPIEDSALHVRLDPLVLGQQLLEGPRYIAQKSFCCVVQQRFELKAFSRFAYQDAVFGDGIEFAALPGVATDVSQPVGYVVNGELARRRRAKVELRPAPKHDCRTHENLHRDHPILPPSHFQTPEYIGDRRRPERPPSRHVARSPIQLYADLHETIKRQKTHFSGRSTAAHAATPLEYLESGH